MGSEGKIPVLAIVLRLSFLSQRSYHLAVVLYLYPILTGTKLNYRPGKRPKLNDDSVSTNVNLMQFDEVFDGDDDEEIASSSASDDLEISGKKKDGENEAELDKEGPQFAESFNPLMRFSRGDLDNMDKEVDDMVRPGTMG